MNLIVVGLNHRTAPIEVREKLWYSTEEMRLSLPQFKEKLFRECVLISTCNRTEIYGIQNNDPFDAVQALKLLTSLKNVPEIPRDEYFYTLHSSLAVSHLFKVASGIDSMVLGDFQIVNQMKEAYMIAADAKTVGKLIARLFDTAFHVGKRSRTETQISDGAVSVSYAAVELANKIFADLSKHTALIIGAGETGELTAKHLKSKNIGKLIFTNRTRDKAEVLANQLGGSVINFDSLTAELKSVDIIISSITIPNYILTHAQIQKVMKERGNNPLFIIDIGVPRNIEPTSTKIDNVFLYDIDTLNHIIDKNIEMRRAEIPKVKKIIFEELEQFYSWYKSLQVTPTIQELRDQFETIRNEEVGKNINRFPKENRELVDVLTKRIVNKILHTPIVNLKNNTNGQEDDETIHKISIIRNIFGLERNKKN
jgi:glutamyl-tRNA reductase